ncbi:hypothetical protein E4N85_11230 [Treponema denticola]|uniref:hypothetical protein n=1 Tax=Treponema denticola TaxID=158 RepID=UPI0020A5FF73|nr:hypothetical protein [Treponema denticola]UTC96271.1 hypothetical protein E4N85_11230 [Treponema denticola]
MNKRIILTVIFICSVFIAAYSQNMDLKHYMDDSSLDDGYAVALYIPPNKESTVFDNFSKEPGRDLTKLSKSNVWLCWQALNEYDISDGESYIVLICKSLFSPESIALYVTITNNGTSFKYWGKVLKNDKL